MKRIAIRVAFACLILRFGVDAFASLVSLIVSHTPVLQLDARGTLVSAICGMLTVALLWAREGDAK